MYYRLNKRFIKNENYRDIPIENNFPNLSNSEERNLYWYDCTLGKNKCKKTTTHNSVLYIKNDKKKLKPKKYIYIKNEKKKSNLLHFL